MNINSNSEVKVSYFFKYTVKIANFCVPLPHAIAYKHSRGHVCCGANFKWNYQRLESNNSLDVFFKLSM